MKDWKTAKSFFFKFQTARSDGWKKMKDWKTAKSFFCEFPIRSNERRLMLKENERLKFEKKWNLRFQQRSWDSAQNFEKWKLSQKIEPADINLKISTKNGPQKLFDIKIRTPGRKLRVLPPLSNDDPRHRRSHPPPFSRNPIRILQGLASRMRSELIVFLLYRGHPASFVDAPYS